MPNFPPSQRPQAPGAVQGEALDALLRGDRPPADAALSPVADLLAALTAAPEPAELAGHEQAMGLFRDRPGAGMPAGRAGQHRRRRMPPLLLGGRAAAAAAAAAAVLGLATAAYAGVLPVQAQRLAHAAFGAPAPHNSHGPRGHPATPAGPDPYGPAAFGLCNAYAHAKAHGTAPQQAVAFRNLAAAAGGKDRIAAYCASVPHSGSGHGNHSPGQGGQPPGHSPPGGQPHEQHSPHGGRPSQSASPSPSPTTSSPSPSPSPSPTPKRHGKPSSHPTAHSTKAAG